jgi:hypothetical protein
VSEAVGETRILLVAGRVKPRDRVGHHDYLGGCALLADLLAQTPGVVASVVRDGWPADPATLDGVRALVWYMGGGGKQSFLQDPARTARIQRQVERGAGIAMIHQAVRFPPDFAAQGRAWIGGAHVPGRGGRGHWRTRHREFPEHPITRGVRPWTIRDGWMNGVEFVEGMRGVTPLVWSSRRHGGDPAGGEPGVVAWAYERPGGGRGFAFTGLDAHSAWSRPGVRQLLVNGILWSAGLPVPAAGAPCAIEDSALSGYLTPREPWRRHALAKLLRRFRRRNHFAATYFS